MRLFSLGSRALSALLALIVTICLAAPTNAAEQPVINPANASPNSTIVSKTQVFNRVTTDATPTSVLDALGATIGHTAPTPVTAPAQVPAKTPTMGFTPSMIFDWCRLADTDDAWCDTRAYDVTSNHVVMQETDGHLIDVHGKLWHLDGIRKPGTYQLLIVIVAKNGSSETFSIDPATYMDFHIRAHRMELNLVKL